MTITRRFPLFATIGSPRGVLTPVRARRRRFRFAWLLQFAATLGACASTPVMRPRATVSDAPSADASMIAIVVELPAPLGRMADERERAIATAMDRLLFEGLTGSRRQNALIPAGMDTSTANIRRFRLPATRAQFVDRVDGPTRTATGQSWSITIDLLRLRRSLETANVVPRLGIP